jgi:ABC-2 type transport system permease protein
MRNYSIFLKKELFEAFKTYKLLIMGAVFFLLGTMSPLMGRFTPEILKWAIESDPSMAGMDLSALIIEPIAFDSWVQFYGNVGQMGMIVLVIVFSGMLASEMSKGSSNGAGTLTIMLSKGLSRSAVILSKLTSAVLIWTVSFVLSALTAWGYTIYLFEDSVDSIENLFFAMLCMWLFGLFLLAVTVFAATVTSKGYTCMLTVGAIAILLSVVSVIPKVDRYNPVSLSTSSLLLLNGESVVKDFYPAIAVTIIGIVAFVSLAIVRFSKKRF